MTFLAAIFIGLVVGLVARFLMPGPDRAGILVTILLGIGGAVVATWIGQSLGWYAPGEHASFGAAVLGAVLILGIYRLVARRNRA